MEYKHGTKIGAKEGNPCLSTPLWWVPQKLAQNLEAPFSTLKGCFRFLLWLVFPLPPNEHLVLLLQWTDGGHNGLFSFSWANYILIQILTNIALIIVFYIYIFFFPIIIFIIIYRIANKYIFDFLVVSMFVFHYYFFISNFRMWGWLWSFYIVTRVHKLAKLFEILIRCCT